MSKCKLTDAIAKDAQPDPNRERVIWDNEVRGFGLRISARGMKTWILNYATKLTGRQRQISIGRLTEWEAKRARERAKELRREVDAGGDPMGDIHAWKEAPTVKDLADRYREVHLPTKRPGSAYNDELMLKRHVEPRLGKLKVASVTHADISNLHRELTAKRKSLGNATVALLSTMFNLAVREEWIDRNPCKGVRLVPQQPRERYASEDELARLNAALDQMGENPYANVFRLCLLTGARISEVMGATWAMFDLDHGVWSKPASTTKQKRVHRVPLSPQALAVLRSMRDAEDQRTEEARRKGRILRRNEFVFPSSRIAGGHLQRPEPHWRRVTELAKLENFRRHDMRHSFASVLVGQGLSLPVIGALLGHTQTATTARYAHLADEVLRKATEAAGTAIAAAQPKIARLEQARRAREQGE